VANGAGASQLVAGALTIGSKRFFFEKKNQKTLAHAVQLKLPH
jgi:hypothetical protein